MGRNSTGIVCTNEVMKLDISSLIKDGMFKKGVNLYSCTLTWTDDGSISIAMHNSNGHRYIRLCYLTGAENRLMDYQINIVSIPSNLGKGSVLYFVCPDTGNNCRILYKTYRSDIFKSRAAYKTPIYYRLQQTSKRWLPNTKYWVLDRRIKELEKMRFTDTYKGVKTKRALLLERLKNEKAEADRLRLIKLAGGLLRL